MTTNPTTDIHLRTKIRVLIVWWIAQFFVCVLLVNAWGTSISRVDGPRGNWLGWFDSSDYLNSFEQPGFWVSMAIIHAGFMLLQALFLLPVRRPRPRQARGVPLLLSAAVGGLGAGALLVGLGFACFGVMQLMDWLFDISDSEASRALMVAFWCAVAASWILGTLLVRRFMIRSLDGGRDHEDTLSRVASTLLKGTMIEALAVIPLDVMLRRKTDCYSFTGTMWTLTLCFSVGLLTIGPAIILPLLSRRRKEWWQSRCECCGYDISSLLNISRELDRCPECGAGWKAGS